MSDFDEFWTLALNYDATDFGEENADESSGAVTLPFCISHPKLGALTTRVTGASRADANRKAQELANACSSAAGSTCSVHEGECRR